MPSREFMQEILSSEQARLARGETLEPQEEPQEETLPLESLPEQPEEAEEDQEETPDQGEQAEGEEKVADDDTDDDEAEADEEPEPAEAHEDFYLGNYRTKEDATKGLEEHRRYGHEKARLADEQAQRITELEQQLAETEAYYRGREAGRPSGEVDEEFYEWADAYIQRDPEAGLTELIRVAAQTGEDQWINHYFNRWAESDDSGYAQARRLRLESDLAASRISRAMAGEQEPQPEPSVDDVVLASWAEFVDENPGITREEAQGASKALGSNPRLRDRALEAARNHDTEGVKLAMLAAMEIYRGTRTAPRRVRRSDAEQLQREKRAATVATGDGAPSRRSASSDLSPEEEMLLAGADKLGLRRRDE